MATPLVYVALAPEMVTELYLDEQLDRLRDVAEVELWQGQSRPSLEAVSDALKRAQVILTGWGTPSLKEPLELWSPQNFTVRLIAHTAGTVKHLMPAHALERGLHVTHAADTIAEAVADFTLGAMIAARRQMFSSAARLRAGRSRPAAKEMRELRGSTVGIISASSVGRKVMRVLEPWGVTLLLYDPYCPQEVAAEYGATLVSLEQLLGQSDIVTLHAPMTDETSGMLGAKEFASMKDGAFFLNAARGQLIDHDALLKELQSGRLSALLDVTDPQEPLPPGSPFFELENCTVLPHIAGHSLQSRKRQSTYMVDEILRFFRGEELHYAISPKRFAMMA